MKIDVTKVLTVANEISHDPSIAADSKSEIITHLITARETLYRLREMGIGGWRVKWGVGIALNVLDIALAILDQNVYRSQP